MTSRPGLTTAAVSCNRTRSPPERLPRSTRPRPCGTLPATFPTTPPSHGCAAATRAELAAATPNDLSDNVKRIPRPRVPFPFSGRLRNRAALRPGNDGVAYLVSNEAPLVVDDAPLVSNGAPPLPSVNPRLLTVREQEQLLASAERHRATVHTIDKTAADASAAAFLAPFAERSLRDGQELIIGIARKQAEERRGSEPPGCVPRSPDPR